MAGPNPSPTEVDWSEMSSSTRLVALEVLLHGPLARTELSHRLGLSSASLTRLTKPLMALGLLHDSEPASQRGTGRPLQPLEIEPGLESFVGVKLTGFRAYAVLTNLRAQIQSSAEAEIDDRHPHGVVTTVVELVRELIRTAGSPVRAVGVGLGGVVHDHSLVVRAPFLGWRHVDFGSMLTDLTHLPTVVANDIDALTEAEHWFGEGRDVSSFAVLTIGAGVGCGIVVHDRLVEGKDSGIGLMGHQPLDPNGPVCAWGHRGCADSMLTTSAIESQASMALGTHVSYAQVLERARAGDPTCGALISRAAQALGTLVTTVANVIQPEHILLTGEGIELARVAEDQLTSQLAGQRDPDASHLDIRIRDDDPQLWARGAAAFAIQRIVLDERSSTATA